jgi:DNA gyrase subunit B
VDGSHIRTLLLTFFYRQMPLLIDRGHVFIAQPPLFRAKRGRTETYIKDERELESFLIRRAVESRVVKMADGAELFGETLEHRLQKMMGYRKLLQQVTRRGMPPEIVTALLHVDARDKSFFDTTDRLDVLSQRMTTPNRTVNVGRDDEHNAFFLDVEDRSHGYPRRFVLGVDFISSGEYRTLMNAYREIHDIRFPVVVKTMEAARADEVEDTATAAADGSAIGGAPLDEATRLAAEPKDRVADAVGTRPVKKEADITLADPDAFVEYFITAGKKGIAVNRYKGLGEMNPDTLWSTTMDPEVRTLLEVRAEDHAEADQMFTTLMGDQVEPRRKFIEDNALDVRNLDV